MLPLSAIFEIAPLSLSSTWTLDIGLRGSALDRFWLFGCFSGSLDEEAIFFGELVVLGGSFTICSSSEDLFCRSHEDLLPDFSLGFFFEAGMVFGWSFSGGEGGNASSGFLFCLFSWILLGNTWDWAPSWVCSIESSSKEGKESRPVLGFSITVFETSS